MRFRPAVLALTLFAAVTASADVPGWVRAAVPPAMPEWTKDAPAVVLLDHRVLNVAPGG
jgi:hypothetical protein